MRVTRDRGVDLGHIEGVVMNIVVLPNTATREPAAFALEKFHSKICAPTRIAGCSVPLESRAGIPNRRT
jgi:hypothetical protein